MILKFAYHKINLAFNMTHMNVPNFFRGCNRHLYNVSQNVRHMIISLPITMTS